MTAQSAGAVDAATESASEKDSGANTQGTSLSDALLAEARDMGHSIGDVEIRKPEAETAKDDESEKLEEETVSETEQTDETEEAEETDDPKESKETKADQSKGKQADEGKHASVEDQLKQYADRGEKPPWYLTRISEETRKKNDRTSERNTALQEVERLKGEVEQLRSQSESRAPVANGQSPLANCWTQQDFESLERECNRTILWAEENRQGGDFVYGKDGNEELSRELSAKEVTGLKLAAEATLRDMPLRRSYVEKFSEAKARAEAAVSESYPNLSDPNSDEAKEVEYYLRTVPALRQIPDIKLWLGHALRGRSEWLAERNGKSKAKSDNGKADRIAKSVQETRKVAPVIPKSRGVITRGNRTAEVDKATESLERRGTQDDGVAWLEARGIGGGSKSTIERVE